MKQIISKIFTAIIFSGILVSCKKGSSGINISGNTKLLTQQEWKISKEEEKVNSDPYIDHFPTVPACTRDDKYGFRTDGTYELNEGATKCNASDPQVIYNGTWQFTQNETKIKIDGNESTIEQLDNTTFIISGSYISVPDTNYYRITFVH